jgi:hypothetical protein
LTSLAWGSAWFAVWSFGLTLFVFGIVSVVEFARLLWETK